MTRPVVVNALSTRPGGSATVWAALFAGIRELDTDLRFELVVRDPGVENLVRSVNPDATIHVAPPRQGISSFVGESRTLTELIGSDPRRIVVTHNRMTRSDDRQAVVHINLPRFQRGSGARGWKQRPAEIVRNRVARRALEKADANIFESRFLHDAAKQRYPDLEISNPSVAYVGIEAGWSLPPDAAIPSLTDRGRRILAVTSPNPHKDNPRLVLTLAKLNHDNPDPWTLAIAGGRSPEVWSSLMDLAERVGVADSIEPIGFLDRPGLAAELDRAVMLVSTSRVESFAMVPLEAMARGVPAVMCDEASMPESVGSAGVLVSGGDERAFAAAVRELAVEPEWSTRSRLGREWAATKTWKGFAESVVDTLEKIP